MSADAWSVVRAEHCREDMVAELRDTIASCESDEARNSTQAALNVVRRVWQKFFEEQAGAGGDLAIAGASEELVSLRNMNLMLRRRLKRHNVIARSVLHVVGGEDVNPHVASVDRVMEMLDIKIRRFQRGMAEAQDATDTELSFIDGPEHPLSRRKTSDAEAAGEVSSEITPTTDSDKANAASPRATCLIDFWRLADFKLRHAAQVIGERLEDMALGGSREADVASLRLTQLQRDAEMQQKKHVRAMEALQSELDTKVQALENELASLRKSHEADMGRLRNEHAVEVERLNALHQDELSLTTHDFQLQLEQAMQAARDESTLNTEQMQLERAQQLEKMRDALAEERKRHEATVQRLKDQPVVDFGAPTTAVGDSASPTGGLPSGGILSFGTLNESVNENSAGSDTRFGPSKPRSAETFFNAGDCHNAVAAFTEDNGLHWDGETRETLIALLKEKHVEIEMQQATFGVQMKARAMEWETLLRDTISRYDGEIQTLQQYLDRERARTRELSQKLEASSHKITRLQSDLKNEVANGKEKYDEMQRQTLHEMHQLKVELRDAQNEAASRRQKLEALTSVLESERAAAERNEQEANKALRVLRTSYDTAHHKGAGMHRGVQTDPVVFTAASSSSLGGSTTSSAALKHSATSASAASVSRHTSGSKRRGGSRHVSPAVSRPTSPSGSLGSAASLRATPTPRAGDSPSHEPDTPHLPPAKAKSAGAVTARRSKAASSSSPSGKGQSTFPTKAKTERGKMRRKGAHDARDVVRQQSEDGDDRDAEDAPEAVHRPASTDSVDSLVVSDGGDGGGGGALPIMVTEPTAANIRASSASVGSATPSASAATAALPTPTSSVQRRDELPHRDASAEHSPKEESRPVVSSASTRTTAPPPAEDATAKSPSKKDVATPRPPPSAKDQFGKLRSSAAKVIVSRQFVEASSPSPTPSTPSKPMDFSVSQGSDGRARGDAARQDGAGFQLRKAAHALLSDEALRQAVETMATVRNEDTLEARVNAATSMPPTVFGVLPQNIQEKRFLELLHSMAVLCDFALPTASGGRQPTYEARALDAAPLIRGRPAPSVNSISPVDVVAVATFVSHSNLPAKLPPAAQQMPEEARQYANVLDSIRRVQELVRGNGYPAELSAVSWRDLENWRFYERAAAVAVKPVVVQQLVLLLIQYLMCQRRYAVFVEKRKLRRKSEALPLSQLESDESPAKDTHCGQAHLRQAPVRGRSVAGQRAQLVVSTVNDGSVLPPARTLSGARSRPVQHLVEAVNTAAKSARDHVMSARMAHKRWAGVQSTAPPARPQELSPVEGATVVPSPRRSGSARAAPPTS